MKIPGLRRISLFASFLLVILLNTGCSKKSSSTLINANIPLVTTTGVIINVTATTAQSGGILVNAENGTVSTSGVCYSSTNKVPTTSDAKTTDTLKDTGTSLKSFTSKLTGLTANTTYYLRAYCINEAGVGYGGVLTFTTTGNGSIVATVSTFAGNGTAGYLDGSLSGAMFNNPQGVSVDASGNVYVSDSFNDLIRKLSTTGTTSTIAGNQSIGLVNGPALSAEFYAPNGQAVDAQGNIYVADFGNNVIRKITPAGVVSTYAGTGVAGYRNGAKDTANWKGVTDSLAVFNNPEGVAVDAAGNVYVADRGNNVIREILTNGRTKTVAGNQYKAFIDATGASAFFNNPTGVAVDSKGNLYVTDQGNSALRKITPGGVVTTLAGNPVQTYLLNYPSAIAIDANDNLFIADEGGRIMEYNAAGVLYYLAGALNSPGNTDGNGATARFNYPQGIAVDGNGNVYVADQYNNVIRKITFSTSNVNVARRTPVTIVRK